MKKDRKKEKRKSKDKNKERRKNKKEKKNFKKKEKILLIAIHINKKLKLVKCSFNIATILDLKMLLRKSKKENKRNISQSKNLNLQIIKNGRNNLRKVPKLSFLKSSKRMKKSRKSKRKRKRRKKRNLKKFQDLLIISICQKDLSKLIYFHQS